MRILISHDDGSSHGLGRGALIVDDVTHAYVQELRDVSVAAPDEILTIRNARVHVSAGSSGMASLRAGFITDIREI